MCPMRDWEGAVEHGEHLDVVLTRELLCEPLLDDWRQNVADLGGDDVHVVLTHRVDHRGLAWEKNPTNLVHYIIKILCEKAKNMSWWKLGVKNLVHCVNFFCKEVVGAYPNKASDRPTRRCVLEESWSRWPVPWSSWWDWPPSPTCREAGSRQGAIGWAGPLARGEVGRCGRAWGTPSSRTQLGG